MVKYAIKDGNAYYVKRWSVGGVRHIQLTDAVSNGAKVCCKLQALVIRMLLQRWGVKTELVAAEGRD